MSLPPSEYVSALRALFHKHGNPDVALGQMAYMRHQFEYFGLKMPAWSGLTKQFHTEYGVPEGAALMDVARYCFEDDHREMQYFALETVQKCLKQQGPDFIYFLEELALTRSWWDTVDWIQKLAGQHLLRHPDLMAPIAERWVSSDNVWLQRLSIIFQLSYKNKTRTDILFGNIRRLAASKEFFIQKAAGWALRQYARTDPEAVRAFVAATPLATLTRREALKHIALVRGE